jgi:hypothetical protein
MHGNGQGYGALSNVGGCVLSDFMATLAAARNRS